jgi:hypothetical protein
MNAAEGGQANVDNGITLGIPPPLFINGWDIISSRFGLLDESNTSILDMIFFAASPITICSGNEY